MSESPQLVIAPPPDAQSIPGPNVLIEGPAGTGKTYSLGTLADWCAAHGKTMAVLFVEQGVETLLGYWRDRGVEVPACLHWHTALVRPMGITSLIDAADKVGKMSYKMLADMTDANRGGENNAYWQILKACADFPDDRTGKRLGPVDKWAADRVFAIDSLSELSNAAMKMQIGNKPTAAPSDYMVAQNNLLNFLRLCTQGMSCTFALTAHVARETDEVTQTTKLMTKSIGRALGGELPPLFSDVIYTVREGDQFYWDTAAYGVDTKTRSLGYRSKIKPDFAQIMDLWIKRGGK